MERLEAMVEESKELLVDVQKHDHGVKYKALRLKDEAERVCAAFVAANKPKKLSRTTIILPKNQLLYQGRSITVKTERLQLKDGVITNSNGIITQQHPLLQCMIALVCEPSKQAEIVSIAQGLSPGTNNKLLVQRWRALVNSIENACIRHNAVQFDSNGTFTDDRGDITIHIEDHGGLGVLVRLQSSRIDCVQLMAKQFFPGFFKQLTTSVFAEYTGVFSLLRSCGITDLEDHDAEVALPGGDTCSVRCLLDSVASGTKDIILRTFPMWDPTEPHLNFNQQDKFLASMAAVCQVPVQLTRARRLKKEVVNRTNSVLRRLGRDDAVDEYLPTKRAHLMPTAESKRHHPGPLTTQLVATSVDAERDPPPPPTQDISFDDISIDMDAVENELFGDPADELDDLFNLPSPQPVTGAPHNTIDSGYFNPQGVPYEPTTPGYMPAATPQECRDLVHSTSPLPELDLSVLD